MKRSRKASCILWIVGRLAWVIALAAASSVGVAVAEPAHVEVRALAGERVSASLLETLRIHLVGSANVEVGPPLEAATLPDRIAEASAAVPAGGLVTWLEVSPDETGRYVVVVVGDRGGRAAVEVGTLEASEPDAISRLLALRIGAFLDETVAAGSASPIAEPAVAVEAPPLAAVAASSEWRWIAEIGGGGELDGERAYGDGALAVGVRHARAARVIEAVMVGRLGWPRRTSSTSGEIELDVADAALRARLLVPVGLFWIGPSFETGARRIHAAAMATSGATGAAVRWIPRVRVSADARVHLSTTVAVHASLGMDRGLEVERFTVYGEALATVGALSGSCTLSLVLTVGEQ